MKGSREIKGPPSADLLVCFPSRAHLTLMPKPICSPARPSDQSTSHHHHRRRRHLRKSGHGSPLLWGKTNNKANNSSDISEPTSPKVTCAGQIKVRPKPSPCKSWQSVMEEIERLHNKKKAKKSSAWIDALGFKKDVAQFLTCLRNLRLDFRCFGAFPAAEISSSSDDDDGDDDEEPDRDENSSRAIFSKWFMILPENENKSHDVKGKTVRACLDEWDNGKEEEDGGTKPPPNALLLMRCRSAPAKSWVEEEDKVVVMAARGPQYSADVGKETSSLVEGGIKDLLSRSRSSRR